MSQRLIKISRVTELTGLSSSSIYRLASKGEFPKPIKLSQAGRSSAWVSGEVAQWIEDRIKDSRSEA